MPLVRQQQRRDTTANWTLYNPVLLDGEFGVDTTADRVKIGDGVTAWDALPFSDKAEQVAADAARAEAAADEAVAVATGDLDPANAVLLRDPTSETARELSTSFAPRTRRPVPLFVFMGESNSGGLALNSDLPSSALLPRPAVRIWDNVNNDGFDVLDIGTNNLLGHDGITGVADREHTCHGWEHALATSAEAGEWAAQVYLVKAGQGGSILSQWDDGDAYWTTFVARLTGAVAALRAQGLDPQVYVFSSIGINDAGAGTSAAAYKTALTSWITRIRAVVRALTGTPAAPFAFTQLPAGYSAYNTKLVEVAAQDELFSRIDTTGLPTSDGLHWTAASMLTIGRAMCDVMRLRIGQGAQYDAALASTVSGPLALLTRIEALEAALFPPVVPVDVVWTSLTAATDSGGGTISNAATTPAGGLGSVVLDPARFAVVGKLVSAVSTAAAILCIESTADTDYTFGANPFLAGLYQFGDDIYAATRASDATMVLPDITYPAKLRLRNAGSDVAADYSANDGATWTPFHTFTGALSGVDEVHVKALFAGPNLTLTVQAA